MNAHKNTLKELGKEAMRWTIAAVLAVLAFILI